MDPSADSAPGGMAAPKVSTLALMGMALVGGVLLASIFAYILVLAPMAFDARLWWMGLASGVFALAFFFLYAGTRDRRVMRPLAAAFFVITAGSFYASIFSNPDPDATKVFWLVILSILVVVVLAAMFMMARDAERDAARRARRKVTP